MPKEDVKRDHYRHRKDDPDCYLPDTFNWGNMESLRSVQNRYATKDADKQKAKAIKQALELLISEGMIPPESAPTAV